jgi:hypothetical protein
MFAVTSGLGDYRGLQGRRHADRDRVDRGIRAQHAPIAEGAADSQAVGHCLGPRERAGADRFDLRAGIGPQGWHVDVLTKSNPDDRHPKGHVVRLPTFRDATHESTRNPTA